jgi:hypothetical protein
MRRCVLALPLLLAFAAQPACGRTQLAAESVAETPVGPDLAAWARVLSDFVRDGGVDYAALAARPQDLEEFLASLSAARPESMRREEALAFWSNAYNAVVLHHVLERYPGIESVKEVDGFFDVLTFGVAGEELTLDEIESRGRELGDPRIHFAVVCASTSCPDLLGEPFRADRIDEQLDRQTLAFLGDPTKGMRYDADSETLWLSSIFKWYAGDFTGGSTVLAYFARGGVADWVRDQLPAAAAARLGDSPKVRYLDYDWNLNDRPVDARRP